MTSQRVVRKSLAGEEDLLFGEGTVTQSRNGQDYTITKIAVARTVATVAALKAKDLEAGQLVGTLENSAGKGGGAVYRILTALEYGGTPDGYVDHLLANGNVAVLYNTGSIDLKQVGAVGDGVTDDTLAVQAAINYALSFTTPVAGGQSLIPILEASGNHLLTASINIDRPENQTGWLRIRSKGRVGGFTTATAITLFSTTYTGSDRTTPANSQLTNQVSFESLTFSSTVAGAHAIDATKFVRSQCLNCFFSAIAFNPDPTNSYIQSFYLDNCIARGVSANKFMQAEDAYDVKVTGSKFEVIGDTVIFFSVRALGCEFSANLSQNCGNNFINIAQTQGVSVTGNYVEANDGRFLKIDDSRGTACSGNFIQSTTANAGDTNFFEVQIGESLGFTAQGNYFTGRGFDVTGTSKIALIDQTNVASLALVNPGQAYTRRIEGSIEPRDGVYLGGAAATNLLSDYQEGSFTAALTPSGSGSITLTASSDTLTYTKVGSLVTIVGMIEVASVSAPTGTDIQLSALPFTPVDGPEFGGRFGGCVTWNQGGGTFTATPIQGLEGNTTLNIKGNAGTVAAGHQFYFSFSYRV